MKSKVIFMSILFLGLFFTTNQSNAQCGGTIQPCVPDCPNDQWSSPPDVVTYTVEPGCNLTIRYVHRFACNQFYDYQIIGVTVVGSCSFGTGIDEVLDAATVALLAGNPQNFPVSSCTDDLYRATKAVCWSDDGNGCYTPCPPPQCDLELYRVCNGVVRQISRWSPQVDCILPCEPVTPLSE